MGFPYNGWVLQTSMRPMEVTLVDEWLGYHMSEKGKYYHKDEIFKTQQDAVRFGFEKIEKMESALVKQSALINKRKATLEKYRD